MDDILLFVMLLVSLLINLSSLDDLVTDFLACGIIRRKVPPSLTDPTAIPTTAIFVAHWHEENVLARMVEGNLARIPFPQVSFCLGVYPNDIGTRDVALALAEEFPDRVRVVINSLPGPTSKGQMLNEMFKQVFTAENAPELVIMHDSEGIIDPRTFGVYVPYAQDGYDFIQVPVFSLNSTDRSRVAATYMDEFAEWYTLEMIVRDALGAMIPSAGVGTGMTRHLLQHFVRTRGHVLANGCVTEDYILGVEAKRNGFRAAFAAISADERVGVNFVATREFFPKTLAASIKQKTRWVFGINFEEMQKLGWEGDLCDKYFFMRDRKGMITNFLPPISLVFLLLVIFGALDMSTFPIEWEPLLVASMTVNLAALFLRYFIRLSACKQVYGVLDPIGVTVRWLVALYINMVAVWRAWKTYIGESGFATKPIVWSKTTHELPDDFMNTVR
jgi:bacteriophage N4 adsorption protein B